MVKTFAKRNHYNPCFWTALWNRDYFDAWIAGRHADRVAREQTVFALNLRSDKVRRTKVAEVHYEKNLGVAEITPESMKQFCKRWFPQEYRRLSRYVARNPETLYMDFEDILAGIENRGIYSSLMKAAKIGEVDSAEHKGFLVSALVTHAMRSHEFMTSMVGGAHNIGLEKWEYFWLLKNAWGNPLTLARAVIPLAMGQWTFYRAAGHRFPLCDSPIMIRRDTLMAVLSPRLVLKISLNVRQREDHWIVKESMSPSRYQEFRTRAIANSFRDIIFHDPTVLNEWRSLEEYRARIQKLSDPASRTECVREAALRVMWAVSGFGRVPDDFETWAPKYLHAGR